MTNKEIVLEGDSSIIVDLNVNYLIGSIIEDLPDKIIFHVSNVFTNFLERDREKIETYCGKKMEIEADSLMEKRTRIVSQRKTERIGVLTGVSTLNPEYVNIPYFEGRNNKFAIMSVSKVAESPMGGILFLYGRTGSGKSHLVQKKAYEWYKFGGKSVYYNFCTEFFEEMKGHVKRERDKSFASEYARIECFILDDFQFFNVSNPKLAFSHTMLFEVLNTLIERGRIIVFTSDNPLYMYDMLPERILSRLKAGYVVELENPGDDIKSQYIVHYDPENYLGLNDKMMTMIMRATENIREVKSILNKCLLHRSEGDLTETKLQRIVESMGAKHIPEYSGLFKELYNILSEYFAVLDVEVKVRKPRKVAQMHNVLYYLCHGKIDVRDLRQKLGIDSKHHARVLQYGKRSFEHIDNEEVLEQLQGILSKYVVNLK